MKSFTYYLNYASAILILIFLSGNLCYGQLKYDPKAIVPLDPAYKTGSLPNGIRYIIRGDLPEKKAYFYAFYNIGSIQEEPNEYGIAHLVEHIAFHGTNRYKNYIKSKGLSFGKSINGSTGKTSTRYTIFGIPSDDEALIDTSLLMLKVYPFISI